MAVQMISSTRAEANAEVAHPEKRVALYFIVTGFLALMVGGLLGPFQAFNYAGIDLYGILKPLIKSYYQGLTLHGVLNVLVFTTYALSGFMLYVTSRELNLRPNMTFAWASYIVMTLGLVIAGVAILANTSSVMYTFYPPLQGHWGFYVGAALIVVASLMVGIEVFSLRHRWLKANPGELTPLATYMATVTYMMWTLASLGIVVEVVWFLIPWSFGWREGVDPTLMRTLFWYTGHPIVYFWLLPAYISWYIFLPRQAGGVLVSDSLSRLAFLMFLLFSTPVGFHHQFSDPSVPAGWKMIHSMLTMFVGIPSMLTAFTIAASLEVGGKRRGGKGIFGWIPKLPWGNASFTAQVLAMITFIFGGAGGIVNASFNLDTLVHNTAWIPGHFHLTVGTAVTLTFMGFSFWLVPHLIQRPLFAPKIALASAWLWGVGMMIFGVGMHWQGILAVPRRAYVSNMADNVADAYTSAPYVIPRILTGISGGILFLALIAYFVVLFGTLWSRKTLDKEPEMPFTEPTTMRREGLLKVMDSLWIWMLIAIFLVVVAYMPTLVSFFGGQVPVPGYKPW